MNDTARWTLAPFAIESWKENLSPERRAHLHALGTQDPSLKLVAFLALLEHGARPCTYGELERILGRRGVVTGEVPRSALRVALSDLGRTLDRGAPPHPLRLWSTRVGRESHFHLRERGTATPATRRPSSPVLLLTDPPAPEAESREIAYHLVKDRRLPFFAAFSNPRSAAWWVHYSSRYDTLRTVRDELRPTLGRKQDYEASAWTELGLDERFRVARGDGAVINLVGLAVGEGTGEIQLLREMLETHPTVHYCAIDLSPILLHLHFQALRDVFHEEIRKGRLVAAGVVGNVMRMSESIARVRDAFEGSSTLPGREFLPGTAPTVAAYLGNNLGNQEPEREWEIFSALREALPKSDPATILIGFSEKDDQDLYDRSTCEFFLQTPRYFVDSEILVSGRSEDAGEPPEFSITDENFRERCPQNRQPFSTKDDIDCDLYRFHYRLDYDLALPERELQIPEGTRLLIFTITKYDPRSLVQFLESQRLDVAYDTGFVNEYRFPDGVRRYAVLAAHLPPPLEL